MPSRWFDIPLREAAPRRRRLLPLLALILLGAAPPVALYAQEAAAPPPAESGELSADPSGDLRAEVETHFRVLPLRDGLLLEPLEDLDGIAAVEVGSGGFVVDGVPVTAAELEERLGAAAGAVRRLGELDPAAARELFVGESAGPAPAADELATAPPPVPEPPAPPRERPDRSERWRDRGRHVDAQVVVGNDVVIEADEVARDVVVFGGRLTVRGEVIGDAAAIGGSVVLEPGAEVTGDVASVGGTVTLGEDTEVHGDAASVGNRVVMADSAIVRGQVVEVPFSPRVTFGWPHDGFDWRWDDDWDDWRGYGWGLGRFFELVWKFFALILLALLGCLAYLLARAPVDRMERKVRTEPWKAGLVGLVAQILFVPLLVLVCIILAVSIIGIPLLLLVPFLILALIVVNFLGYTAVAYRLGTWSEERFGWNMVSPYVAVVVGVLLIQVWSFVGSVLDLAPGPLWFFAFMFAVFGALLKYVVWTVGLGAALLTRFGTADDDGEGAHAGLPPLPRPDAEEPAEEAVAETGADQAAEPPDLPDFDWEQESPVEESPVEEPGGEPSEEEPPAGGPTASEDDEPPRG